jgi:hypothetical protein
MIAFSAFLFGWNTHAWMVLGGYLIKGYNGIDLNGLSSALYG